MPKKLANDLMHTNEEYTKLKGETVDDETPRENPDHQSPGNRGLHRPALDTWTTAELRRAAAAANIAEPEKASRSELIDALMRAQQRG